MDLLADKAITITSSNANIKVQAKQEILFTSGGGYIKLAGSNIDIHCQSSLSVKGVTHSFLGGESSPAALSALPEGAAQFETMALPGVRVHMIDTSGNVPIGEAIKLTTNQTIKQVTTDGSGKFELRKLAMDFAADSSQPKRKDENAKEGRKA
jgi:uncharacterized protein (DUF2345 family)